MCQRKRFGIVLLLGVSFLALLSRPVPAQNVASPPAPWSTPGAAPTSATKAPQIIATSKSSPNRTLPADATLPPPDDGLSSLKGKTLPAKAIPAPPGVLVPLPPPSPIQQTSFVVQPPPIEEKKAVPGITPVIPPPPLTPLQRSDRAETGAGLLLLVSGPESSMAGQPIVCQIRVLNTGSLVLGEVDIDVPIPTGTRLTALEPEAQRQGESLRWHLGNLDPGSQRLLRLEAQLAQPGEIHLVPRATFGPAAGLRTSVIRPPFSLAVTGQEAATLGEMVSFQIQVGNHTNEPIANVYLRCTLSAGLGHPEGPVIGTQLAEPLGPGQVRSLQVEAQARAAGRQTLSVAATGQGGHRSQATWPVSISETSLNLVLRGARQVNVGDSTTFRVEMSNPGKVAVGPVRLKQALPEGIEFGSASTEGVFEIVSQAIVWTVPAMQPGEMQAVTFTICGHKPGDWAMPLSASAAGIAEARVTQAIRVDAMPTVSLTVAGHDERISPNGETVCEIRLFNQGSTNVRDGRLLVQIPDNLEILKSEGPTQCQTRGQVIVFEPLGELRPHVDAIYRIRVRGVRPGEAAIRAEMQAAGMEKPLQAFRGLLVAGN